MLPLMVNSVLTSFKRFNNNKIRSFLSVKLFKDVHQFAEKRSNFEQKCMLDTVLKGCQFFTIMQDKW